MAIYSFEGKVPKIDQTAFVHETANITGDVVISRECYIGAGAIIRGDYGSIRVGPGTAIEEGCIIHCPPGEICEIGKSVIFGHGAIVHSSKIEDFAVVGMGAVVSIHAVVGEWTILGEGAVVVENQKVPSRKVLVGNPAKVIGEVTEEHMEKWAYGKKMYVELCSRYRQGLKRL